MAAPFDHSEDRIAAWTAGLRRLARGLCRSEHDADDLVQDTWVAAMRSPPRDVRRLPAWLGVTLRNLVASRHHAAVRRQRHERGAARPEADHPEAPERIETLEVLLSEVRGLEEPFRVGVVLRFLDGPPPRAIGKRLGVPVATVHSRVRRGVERLRERLDRRSGGDRGAWMAALLPFARPGTFAAAALPLATVLMMKLPVVLTLSVLLGGAGVALALLGGGSPPVLGGDAAATAADPGARRAELVSPDARAPVTGSDAGAADAPAVKLAAVRGTCVDAETGAPLAGCRVEFDGMASNDGQVALHGNPPWTDPDPVVTGEDGRFEVRFVANPATQHGLDIRADGRVPRTARWGAFAPGQVEDLGEIAIQRGYPVEGVVLDQDGAPVERTDFGLGGLPLPIAPDMAANDMRVDFTDAAGRFSIPAPMPAGTWQAVKQNGGRYRLVSPSSVTVPLAAPLVVRVERRKQVRGVVVDETGTPVSWVYVDGYDPDGRALNGTWAREDGRFAMTARTADDGPPVRFEVEDFREHKIEDATLAVATRWDQEDIRLVVRRTRSIQLRVVDAGTGQPVEEYAVILERWQARSWGGGEPRHGGTHVGGVVEVGGVVPGENVLVVLPRDPAYAASEPRVFDLADTAAGPVVVEVLRRVPVRVRVVDPDGAAVGGVQVQLVDPGPGGELTPGLTVRGSPWRTQAPWDDRPFEVDAAASDASGRAVLHLDPRIRRPATLRAAHDDWRPVVRAGIAPPVADEVELTLSPGAAVTGRITLPPRGVSWELQQLRVELHPPAGVAGTDHQVEVEADGSFAFRALQDGAWELYVTVRHHYRFGGSSSDRTSRTRVPLAQVAVTGAGTQDLGTLAIALAPARFAGRVLVGGEPPADAQLFLLAADDGAWSGTFGAFPIAADGSVEVLAVPPGRWRPVVVLGARGLDTNARARAAASELVELAPGGNPPLTFRVPRGVLRLRVLTPDGAPASGLRLALWSPDGLPPLDVETDADGVVALDPAPDVPLRVVPRGGAWNPPRDAVEPPALGAHAEVELRLVGR